MGRLIIFILAFSFSGVNTHAQDTSFFTRFQKAVPGTYTDFTADDLGNVYLVINSTQLKKLDNNGDSVTVFNDSRRYGKIHSIDASNPLKILVYYKASSTIVVLDRFLAVKQVIDLRKNNIAGAKAVKLSYDNNIWVFDELENKIRKIDDNGKILLESADLRNVFAEAPSFERISDDHRSVYLYDPSLGWFEFDYYGAFTKKYGFSGWRDAQVQHQQLIGRLGNYIVTAKQNDLDYRRFECRPCTKEVLRFQYQSKKIYLLFADRLEIYDAP